MESIFDVEQQTLILQGTEKLKSKLDCMDARCIVPSFRRTQDPINLVFDHIDSKPLNKIAKEFVKDTIEDAICFISKVFE